MEVTSSKCHQGADVSQLWLSQSSWQKPFSATSNYFQAQYNRKSATTQCTQSFTLLTTITVKMLKATLITETNTLHQENWSFKLSSRQRNNLNRVNCSCEMPCCGYIQQGIAFCSSHSLCLTRQIIYMQKKHILENIKSLNLTM